MTKKELLELLKDVKDNQEITFYVEDWEYGDALDMGSAKCMGIRDNDTLDLRVNYYEDEE